MSQNDHTVPQPYPLGRGFSAQVRLYLQHWMWRRQLGYLLHPSIPASHEPLKVADVACGTGMWLVDLAKELPAAELDGFDISTTQFPHRNWLPPNVTLGRLDIFDPIPDGLIGKYDIVHVGLVVCLVKDDNPLPVLQKLTQMLRPGGYLQWDEADLGGLSRTPATPDLPQSSIDTLYARMDETFKPPGSVTFSWVTGLRELFDQHGLHHAASEYYPIADDIAQPWSCMHMMSVAELIRGIDGPEGDAKDWWDLWEKAAQETQSGVSIRMGMVVAVGQKPGSATEGS